MFSHKITSTTNPKIKNIVRLRSRRKRDKDGLTIVEGKREMAMALEANAKFSEVFVCSALLERTSCEVILKKIKSLEYPVCDTSREVFSKISYGERQEGIIALCQAPCLSLKDLKKKKDPLYVVVEGVEKPGNLGAMLRTCDAAGVDGVIICDGQTDIYNPNIIRSSLGAVFTVQVVSAESTETLKFLKSHNIQVCAATVDAFTLYTEVSMKKGLAIVVGSEHKGLSPFWVNHANHTMKIPMKGSVDSLNVSSSAAILIYEAIRQRGQ